MSDADTHPDNTDNMELLEKAKAEFNREKRLMIKNLPFNTQEKDIHAFMGFNGEFPIEEVQMMKHCNQAVVTLKDPSLVNDAISKLNNTKFSQQTVTVAVYRSEKILCVANLPISMTEDAFRELVTKHGNIDTCFLMRSECAGKSKGYGFVEYNEGIEKVGQIKCALDWSLLDEHTIHCDAIVDSSLTGIMFEDLHSTCLLIDNLPQDYVDSIALRELFSEVVKPVYCQIVTKENVSLGFGILEFARADEAETAYDKFSGYDLNGVKLNIYYCIPGKSAVHMFNRIMFKYGDTVPVNRASLLPDPVYPNPAFLKHYFFKTHVAKHPRLLVQFTENLLHLQEGYVKQLEDKTNTKPGLLGPAPTIPMSPLMDMNLQLGLLSLIVLDMRQNGTYNGQVPEPLGKLKVPTDEEFQQKPEPVSLLGDPLTAQANIILKNLLMPSDNPELKSLSSKDDADTPKLLGRPIYELNMVYLCSLGRIMAMMRDKNQTRGILGRGPNAAPNGPPKPLLEGLMQAGKVAQKLLNTIGINPQNQNNPIHSPNNMMGPQQNQPKSILGEPPNMNMNRGPGNLNNNMQQGSNFMNPMQNMPFNKMNKPGGPQAPMGNMGSFNNNSGSAGDGLLGNYQGQGPPRMNQPPPPLLRKPQSLLSLNLNNKGEGLIPTPNMNNDAGFFDNQGPASNYDDSGYQGGYDDSDNGEYGWDTTGNNYADNDNFSPNAGMTNFNNQNNMTNYSNQPNSNMNNLGNQPNTNMNNFNNQNRNTPGMAPSHGPNLGNTGAMGNFSNQNLPNLANTGSIGKFGNQNSIGANVANNNNQGGVFHFGGSGATGSGNMGVAGNGSHGNTSGNMMANREIKGLMSQDFTSKSPEKFDAAYFSGINARQRMPSGQNMHKMGADKGNSQYNSIAEKAAMYAAGAAAVYKQQYDQYMAQQQGYSNNCPTDDASPNSFQGSQQATGPDNYNSGNYNSFSNSNSTQSGLWNNNNNTGTPRPAGSQFNNMNTFPQNRQSAGTGFQGSYGRDGSRGMGATIQQPKSLMGPPPQLPIGPSSSLNTPQGQKRQFSHILPSPEPSPEGDYIGQHSQGLGGHYADTYATKRRKLTGRFT